MKPRPAWTIALVLLLAAPAGAERIVQMRTEVTLSEGDAFGVTEKIRYDFGSLRRHGILRDIPVRYRRGHAPDYRIAIDVESVSDGSGRERPYELSRRGKSLRIRIGDSRREVTGVQDYWITYRVRRGLLYFDDHDELYWNATGSEWPVSIERAEAEVFLPSGAADRKVHYGCFTGRMGAVETACSVRRTGGSVSFASARALGSHEGLTIVLGLPKGILREPSGLSRFLSRASDYLSGWLALPLGALAGMAHLWRTRGRDPAGRAAIPVRYDPPEGMSPAELGTVVDERADIDDITSTILDLAVRGYLEIEETEAERFFFLSSRDYELRRLDRLDEDLKPHERALLGALFGGRSSVRISSLRNEFYKELPAIRRALYRRVSRKDGYFPVSPERARRVYSVAGAIVLGIGVVGGFVHVLTQGQALSLVIAGGIVLAFGRFMPRRTRKGRRAYEEILGFREFIERVDADRLERLGGRTAERFERILPYAVVLGVADAWSDAFRDIYTEPPRWYRSRAHGQRFHPRLFVDDVGQSLRTMGSTMASRPRGSGSSGFGGGGFSGGGFGGGGGGSW